MDMVEKTFWQWPPQPSTVIGLGVLAGTILYCVTGDPVWAGVAAASVKVLIPDSTGTADKVLGAIASALGRPLPKSDSDS
jgi:hypothetical protein